MSDAKKSIKYDNMKKDLISAGFRKLDDSLVSNRPPKIKWGELYKQFSDKEKIEYLQKIASTMNHAAYLIQEERNGLLKSIDKKEEQLIKMKKTIDQNMEMLQIEITKINEERQEVNKKVAKLNAEIRRLNDNNK